MKESVGVLMVLIALTGLFFMTTNEVMGAYMLTEQQPFDGQAINLSEGPMVPVQGSLQRTGLTGDVVDSSTSR